MEGTIQERAAAWKKAGGGGVSASTIYGFFMSKDYGEPPSPKNPGYPHDFADWARCQKLLDMVPEWQERLAELGEIAGLDGQCWAALAPKWNGWNALTGTAPSAPQQISDEIAAVVVPIEDASGLVHRMGKGVSMRVPNSVMGKAIIEAATRIEAANEREAELFDAAARLVIKEQKASVAFIQRHLQLNHNTASRIMSMLEEANIVSAAVLGARTVRVKTVEHYEKSVLVAERVADLSKNTGIPPEKIMAAAKAAAGVGHNSGDNAPQDTGGVSGQRLKSFMERIERLEEEKAGLAEDIKDIYAEAKAVGFDTKTIRNVIRLRKMDKEKRQEEEQLLELYKSAVGLD